jgi:hypothetical protein
MAGFHALRRVSIHCPIGADTLRAIVGGDAEAVSRDATVAPLLAYVAACPDLGDFGLYRGVCEISLGVEAYTPRPGALPTVGEPGVRSHALTVTISTYVAPGVSTEELGELLAEIARRHPWEVPVIEVEEVAVYRSVPAA